LDGQLPGLGGAESGLLLQQLVVSLFCQTALHFEQETEVSSDMMHLLEIFSRLG
jgi:hypothetical protein